MKLYVYCLSEENVADALEGVTGIAGATPHLISSDAISAVVSHFDGEQVSVTRERVVAHERVINLMLARTTPLPFRFGTVASATDIENYIDAQRESLEAMFARVRGMVEMSVKIIWNKEAATDAEHAEIDVRDQSLGPGRAFLLARQREMAGDAALRRRGEDIARWLKERLSDSVRESVVRVQPMEALVLKASFLVERSRLAEYRERINRAREERSDLSFLTSGAWAPYSFVTFHSQIK
ncbi:MAG TPA: GvpL/GvpF family gas vesicle protein [Blastocatellia bacterium]|jgi:hypothetical protein